MNIQTPKSKINWQYYWKAKIVEKTNINLKHNEETKTGLVHEPHLKKHGWCWLLGRCAYPAPRVTSLRVTVHFYQWILHKGVGVHFFSFSLLFLSLFI